MSTDRPKKHKAPEQREAIVAVASPPGQGGVGVVRLSGNSALDIAERLASISATPRLAHYVTYRHGDEVIDQGLLLTFPAPNSFTGEDVAELQVHGSPVVLQQIVSACCELGARLALPGEFSERAFLNGKMDLAQAEAVADLIQSASAQAARAAVATLTGEFSTEINALAERILKMRILVEASIDFPEEEEDFLAQYNVLENLQQMQSELDVILAHSKQGQVITQGASVALLGPPNAGKSSLLNRLAGVDAAIVTDIPGTTRDLLKVDLVLGGLPLRLIDTAGLRETDDVVEQEGINRARGQVAAADLIIVVLDLAADEPVADQLVAVLNLAGLKAEDARLLVLGNKMDLADAQTTQAPWISISAKNAQGIDDLVAAIQLKAGIVQGETPYSARARHVDALRRSAEHLDLAGRVLSAGMGGEIIAEELREAHQCLGEIVGKMTADELLGEIFSQFCIGK